jgi:hypothetical protein
MTKKILILASIVAVLMMSSCVILATDEIAVEAIVTLITVQDAGKTLKVDYQLKNIGQYDLAGVQARFNVSLLGDTNYSYAEKWTIRYSLPVNSSVSGTMYFTTVIDTFTADTDARPTAVAMDVPETGNEYQY